MGEMAKQDLLNLVRGVGGLADVGERDVGEAAGGAERETMRRRSRGRRAGGTLDLA